jgi:peptidylprolyl isomerase
MKTQIKHTAGLFGLLLALLLLAACGPAQPPADAPPADEAATTAEDSVFVTELPTPAPIVIEDALTTASGLQYVIVETGDGRIPQPGDIVTMHFTGTLADGTVFGDSYSQGMPVTVIYGREQLFPGWEEGLGLIEEGGKIQLIIPPALGFGEEGLGGMIPPNATLIMDVELISAEPTPEPTEIAAGDYTTTDSGLQYVDLVVGDGATPEDGWSVSTDFVLWLAEGAQFISSSQGRDPLTFVLGNLDVVFEGWEEGVRSMQVGGVRQMIIPAALGLGETGGGEIPPNADLILEVTLVDASAPRLPAEVDEDEFTTTESGLRYVDLVEGSGPAAETGQTVTVHYTGWLEDGAQFDSSLDRGQPFTLVLGSGSVIPGWEEGLVGMQAGGTRQLVIPAELGYGEAGAGPIPPNATLIFEVELLEIGP